MTYQEHIQTLQNEIDPLLQEMWDISKNLKSSKSLSNYNHMTEIDKKINVLSVLQNQYLQILNPNYRHYCTPVSVPRHIKSRSTPPTRLTLIHRMDGLNRTLNSNRKYSEHCKSILPILNKLENNSKLHELKYMLDEDNYIRAQDLYMTQFN